MRILIADDHEVVRSGLRSVLEARSGWRVIGEAEDGKDAIRKAIELKPNVAILDYGLPVANGVDATGEIRKGAPGVEVLIFTMHENEALIRKTFAAGARGYLLKSDIKQDLYAAIESVAGHRLLGQHFQNVAQLICLATESRIRPADQAGTPRGPTGRGRQDQQAGGESPQHERQDRGDSPRGSNKKARHLFDGRTRALCRPHKADRTLTEALARGFVDLKALLDGPRFSHTTNSQRNGRLAKGAT
jgi:DNA-binding NarL/FixJ family response regulator